MHVSSLRKVGGSIMLSVPPAILDLLRLEAGATVGLAVDGERLIIHPRPRPKYTLDELLAQCDTRAKLTKTKTRTKEDRDWIDLPPVGREL
jgi:antitoxin ChpS